MFSKLLKSEKTIKIIVLAGVLLILIIFASSVFGNEKKQEETSDSISFEEYADVLEARLEGIIGLIEGVNQVDVLVSIEKSKEDVYADRGNNLSTTISPVARGAVVVCDGARNPVVKEKIVESVSKALGIGVNKICVTY